MLEDTTIARRYNILDTYSGTIENTRITISITPATSTASLSCGAADFQITNKSPAQIPDGVNGFNVFTPTQTRIVINLQQHVTISCTGNDCTECPLLINWYFSLDNPL